MKHTLSFLLTLLLLMPLHAQQLHTTIQYRRPASLRLPEDIHTLLLVNNAPVQPAAFGHKIARNGQTILEDSVLLNEAPFRCLFFLATTLSDQDYLDEVSLLEQPQPTGTSFYARKRLPQAMADSLISAYGVDALLVLNQIVLYDTREDYLTDNDDYYAYLQAYCTTQWTIHRPNHTAPAQFTTSDTLVWDARRTSAEAALKALPDRQTALLDFAAYAGEQLANRLIPHWVEADRYLYRCDNIQVSTGIEFFRRREWGVAVRTWTPAYEAGKTALRQKKILAAAYAAANCAVACEIMEDFSQAIDWSNRAITLFARLKTNDAAQQVVNLRAYKGELILRSGYQF